MRSAWLLLSLCWLSVAGIMTFIQTCKAKGRVGLQRFGDNQFAGQLVLACLPLPIGLVEQAEPEARLTGESGLRMFNADPVKS